MSDSAHEQPSSSQSLKWLALGLLLVVIVVGSYFLKQHLTLEAIADYEAASLEYRDQHPLLTYGIAFVVYVAVTGLSLPGAVPLSLAYGWFFELVPAIVLVSFASTTGATIAMLTSRYLLRDWVKQRFGKRLDKFEQRFKQEGAFYLFSLRLIPVVPFFAINMGMGLTPIRATTFWWVSQLGMLPATVVFVYAGDAMPNVQQLAEQGVSGILTPRIVIAFVILGLFPLAVKWLMNYFGKSNVDSNSNPS